MTRFKTVVPTRFDPLTEFARFGAWSRPRPVARRERAVPEAASAAWRPAVEITETATAYTISLEIPGIEKSDVTVEHHDGVLTIQGEKKPAPQGEAVRNHKSERRYGSFSRAFTLPTDTDGDAVTANFRNGVLTVNVPKPEQRKPTVVEIDA